MNQVHRIDFSKRDTEGQKKDSPINLTDESSLVERSIELSNLDDISDMSRQGLIWEGLEEIERI